MQRQVSTFPSSPLTKTSTKIPSSSDLALSVAQLANSERHRNHPELMLQNSAPFQSAEHSLASSQPAGQALIPRMAEAMEEAAKQSPRSFLVPTLSAASSLLLN